MFQYNEARCQTGAEMFYEGSSVKKLSIMVKLSNKETQRDGNTPDASHRLNGWDTKEMN